MTREEAIKIIERVDICANAAETARDMAIEALREPSMKWIPVTERLPEKHGRYIVAEPSYINESGYTIFIVWFEKKVGFYDSDPEWGDIPMENVTHWMPLPEAPKEVEGCENKFQK